MTSRIILIVSTFPKLSETFIVNKFIGLVDIGLDVHLIAENRNTANWQYFSILKEKKYKNRFHYSWPHSNKIFTLLLYPIISLISLIKAPKRSIKYLILGSRILGWKVAKYFYLDHKVLVQNPKIIHFEFGAIARERMYLKDLLGVKIIVSFRGYDINYVGLSNQNFYRRVWEKADHIHFLGDDLRQRAISRGCPSELNYSLIPPAIDSDYFYNINREYPIENEISNGKFKILSVGRIEWKKGYEYGLKAIKLLRDQGVNCEYTIIGDGNYLEAITFARHQLGLEKNVKFLFLQPHEIVKEQMLQADVFLHPAVSEGFCNAVIEAQAMGLPVICSNADGLRENVSNGVTGFVVPRRNSEALAEKLRELYFHPELRRKMGLAGRERVQRKFKLSSQIDAFNSLYCSLIF
jgi:colanic acid/amylovoran biosynthesis glycosyltransferase